MENNNNMNKSYSNNNGNKNAVWVIVAILVIVGFGLWIYNKNKTTNTVPVVKTEQPADETVLDGIEDVTDGSVTTTTPGAVSISYAQALVTYKDKRIQLGTGTICTATPNKVTYKNGTTIMIDNRAPVARTIKIGSNYSVKAYGFKLIKLSSSTLPMTYLVDCNAQQNVATILLQK